MCNVEVYTVDDVVRACLHSECLEDALSCEPDLIQVKELSSQSNVVCPLVRTCEHPMSNGSTRFTNCQRRPPTFSTPQNRPREDPAERAVQPCCRGSLFPMAG